MASREMELTVKEGETVDLGCRARPGAAFFNPLLRGKPIRLFLRRAGWTDPSPMPAGGLIVLVSKGMS